MSTEKIQFPHDSEDVADFLDILSDMVGVDLEERVRSQVIAWRQRRGLNQTQLAAALKDYLPESRQQWANAPNINRYELGKLGIDFTIAYGIARALRIPFMSLIGPLSGEAQRIASALDDPIVRGLVEALETRSLDRTVAVASVNMLRRLAGLADIVQKTEPPREKLG